MATPFCRSRYNEDIVTVEADVLATPEGMYWKVNEERSSEQKDAVKVGS